MVSSPAPAGPLLTLPLKPTPHYTAPSPIQSSKRPVLAHSATKRHPSGSPAKSQAPARGCSFVRAGWQGPLQGMPGDEKDCPAGAQAQGSAEASPWI